MSFSPVELREVLLTDPNRRNENSIPDKWFKSGTRGIAYNGKYVVPDMVIGDTATLLLSFEGAMKFILNFPVFVPSALDESTKTLPMAGQRRPTSARSRSVLLGLKDESRTPIGHTDTIQLFLFGVTCKKSTSGIYFGDDSIATITDGAGRISAWILDYNENEGAMDALVGVRNKHVIQLNFDLSGDRRKCLQEFLLHNRDAKRTTRGTVQVVENTLIDHEDTKVDMDSVLWSTAVTRTLYAQSKISGTLLELFPWRMEGHKSTNTLFRGKGSSQSIGTALKSQSGLVKKSKYSVSKLAKILDFAMTALYPACTVALRDAHDAYEKPRHKSLYRLHSTLAIKFIVMLTMKLYPHCEDNPKKFVHLVNQVMGALYHVGKGIIFRQSQLKKMDFDRFFEESIFFNTNLFNSGAGNTRTLEVAVQTACDSVIATL